MKRICLLMLLALGGCQTVMSPTGTVQGITLPPGCKGTFTVAILNGMIVNASFQGSCDETASTNEATIKLR